MTAGLLIFKRCTQTCHTWSFRGGAAPLYPLPRNAVIVVRNQLHVSKMSILAVDDHPSPFTALPANHLN